MPLAGRALGFDFDRAQLGGQLVEDSIDVFVPVGATEAHGQLDGFVDHHTVRRLRVVDELEGASEQDAGFDRREFGERPVKVGLQTVAQRVVVAQHATQ